VIYPAVFDDPEQIAIYRAECDFSGGMFSFVLKGGKAAAFDFLRHITSVEMLFSWRCRNIGLPSQLHYTLRFDPGRVCSDRHVGGPGAYLGRH
jgi:cystathionine beta-lyase/cystathionine gamma-synthase